jgi:hypothetical protein
MLAANLENFFNSSTIDMKVEVRENMCQVHPDKDTVSFGSKIAM